MELLGAVDLILVATRPRSNPWIVPLVALAILAGFACLTYLCVKFIGRIQARRDFRRSFEIAKALRPHGMKVAVGSEAALLALLQPFELSTRSDSRRVGLFMEPAPESDEMICMMDYSYFYGSSGHKSWWTLTAALVECGVDLPHFILSKELPFEWLQKLRKLQDFDFPEHPKFNKLFRLVGEDEAAVRGLFSAAVRDELEKHPGLTIEARGSQLLFFRELKVLAPAEWPEFRKEALGLARLFSGSIEK